MKKKACFVCLKNCVRLHGDEDDDPEEEITPAGSSGPAPNENVVLEAGRKEDGPAELYPAFLKKMTELSITSALQMPASFVKSFGTRIGTTVTLQGPGNEKWEVQIGHGKEKNSIEFRDGWLKFVGDHILQIGDQLSFTLIAESHFQVVVFDESGSQKISATDAINSPPTLQHSKVVEVDQAGPSVPFRNKPSARPKQTVRRRIRTDGAVPSVNPDVLAPAVHSSESELRNSDTPEKENKSKEAASEEKSDNDESEPDPDDESDLPLLPPHSIVDGHVVSQRRPVTQAEKDRALLAAQALPITNPKLVVIMARGYVYRGFWMALSRPFAKAHMPKETREVTLLNMAGRKWIVKWLHKEAGSGFSGGWRGFALDHRLEEGDVCVFEVLDQKNYVLLVHIFRVIGDLKEDTRDYSPTPGRSRNADWIQTPTGLKRKVEADSTSLRRHAAGPSSPMKSFNTHTPGKYKAPVRCSKIEDPEYNQTPQKVQMPSSSKRGPKPAVKVGLGVSSPDFVPHETLQYCQKAKKAKASPTTSCEVYAEYASFVTPPPRDLEKVGVGADLNVRPLLTKQSAADKREDDLLKLGKELVQTTKSASPSSSSASDGNEEMQIVPPINVISTRQKKEDLNLPDTCACVSENHVSQWYER